MTRLVAVVVGVATVVALGVLAAAYGARYEGRVYPGVIVAGVDVGGLAPEALISADSPWRDAIPAEIVLRDPGDPADPSDDRQWTLPRSELGLDVAADQLSQDAYRAGRDGLPLVGPIWLRLRGRDVVPPVSFDPERAREALEKIAPLVDRPPEAADVREADGSLVVVDPRFGRQLAIEETLARLAAVAGDPTVGAVEIATTGTAPRFSDAQSVAQAFELATAGPVRMTWRQGQSFTADVAQVRRWIDLQRRPNPAGDDVPTIVVDEDAIKDWLRALAPEIDRAPRPARLDYDPLTGRLTARQPEVPGQELDLDASVDRFVGAAYSEVRTGELAVRIDRPDAAEDLVRELQGRVRVLASASTRVDGQPPARLQNMLLAVEALDGLVIAPDTEMSLARELGAVSEDAGYDLVHVSAGPDGVLLGGLEQVATVAFRAALWAGLPITERHAPPTRMVWGEPPIGLDAALGPAPRDLGIRNDSPGSLILQVRVDGSTGALVGRVIGEPPERDVALVGPIVTDLVPPLEGSVRRDPRVASGEETQVLWARAGGKVAYQRVVRAGGVEVLRDAFVSEYASAGNVVVVGTGP